MRPGERMDLASQGLASWLELRRPLLRSLEYVRAKDPAVTALAHPDLRPTWGQMRASLEALLELLPRLDERPELLQERFAWFELTPDPLMTGYYTPEIEASLSWMPGYNYPLYGVPDDLESTWAGPGRRRFFRVENGRQVPYHDRRAVDVGGVLRGRGLEVAWAKDPLDVFYMQVEGCGRLRLPDGRTAWAVYGAGNGHAFKGLGDILRERGLLPSGRLDKAAVRRYFARHPD